MTVNEKDEVPTIVVRRRDYLVAMVGEEAVQALTITDDEREQTMSDEPTVEVPVSGVGAEAIVLARHPDGRWGAYRMPHAKVEIKMLYDDPTEPVRTDDPYVLFPEVTLRGVAVSIEASRPPGKDEIMTMTWHDVPATALAKILRMEMR